MKKIVYALSLISIIFLINLSFFIKSDSYKNYIKNIKNGDATLINDDYNLNPSGGINSCNCPTLDNNLEINQNLEEKQMYQELERQKLETKQKQDKINISNILNNFSSFNLLLKPYDEYYKIFDITDEYPEIYETYTGEKFEIYFFPKSNFDDLYNIFSLLPQDDLENKFIINSLNNFGVKSFYLNKAKPDEYIRIILDNGKILFGLKIKKKYYPEIKNILNKI